MLAEGVPRVDVDLRAREHRERSPPAPAVPARRRAWRSFAAATTFDVAERTPGARADAGWVQRAPATFAHQGWIHAAGLTVVAPGLPEAEIVPAPGGAVLALTLVRAVGYLSRPDLATRPMLAGPGTSVPGAQCPGELRARLALFAGIDPAAAQDAEWGLRAVEAGPAADALWPEGESLLAIAPRALLLSALKPDSTGEANRGARAQPDGGPDRRRAPRSGFR